MRLCGAQCRLRYASTAGLLLLPTHLFYYYNIFMIKAYAAPGVCLSLLLLAGCSCGSGTNANPDGGGGDGGGTPGAACTGAGALTGCGDACSALILCPSGLYCSDDDTCTADCAQATETEDCGTGYRCTSRGQCLESSGDGGPPVVDSGTCASVSLDSTPVTPNVMLIVDRSLSMDLEDFPAGSGVTRWDRLRSELLATPDGMIASLEDSVRFGLAVYTCNNPGGGNVPFVESQAMALNNHSAISTFWNAREPLHYTPTGPAIQNVLAGIAGLTPPDTRPGEPTIFVLATDGEPNICTNYTAYTTGRAQALTAVQDAYTAGYETYVISVGDGSVSAAHLQDMANAGIGNYPATDPNADYWEVTDTTELETALTTIVSGVRSCTLELQGEIDPDNACQGTVKLGSRTLTCDNASDGWTATDGTHIELLGTACDDFLQDGGTIEATFPCDVVIVVI